MPRFVLMISSFLFFFFSPFAFRKANPRPTGPALHAPQAPPILSDFRYASTRLGLGILGYFLLMGSAGCLYSPGNEGRVENRDSVVEIDGYSGVPNAEVRIFAAPHPSADFIWIANLPTDGLSVFAGQATVPHELWGRSCETGRFETYVRAESSLGAGLITFDDASVNGVSGRECMAEYTARNEPLIGLGECAAEDSSVARVVTEEIHPVVTVHLGDLVIDADTDLRSIECLPQIDGNLRIEDGTSRAIRMAELVEVTGNVDFVLDTDDDMGFFDEVGSHRPQGRSLPGEGVDWMDFPALKAIGGSLRMVFSSPERVDFLQLRVGLPILKHVGGDFVFDTVHRPGTLDLFGLPSLRAVEGGFSFRGATTETALGQFAPNLARIGGNLFGNLGDHQARQIVGFLPGLETVQGHALLTGGLWINDGEEGTMLPRLNSVGGDLSLVELTLETWSDGIALNFPLLTEVGGTLEFERAAGQDKSLGWNEQQSWSAAEFFGAPDIQVGALRINRDPGFTNAARTLGNFDIDPAGLIALTNNPALDQCEAVRAVATLGKRPGPVDVSGNGPFVLVGNDLCPN